MHDGITDEWMEPNAKSTLSTPAAVTLDDVNGLGKVLYEIEVLRPNPSFTDAKHLDLRGEGCQLVFFSAQPMDVKGRERDGGG